MRRGVEMDEQVRSVLRNQYHASLAMLHTAVASCPDDTWYDTTPTNAFWQIAYHALFFAHLYLQPDEHAFRPWPRHQSNTQNPDGIPGEPDPNSALPLVPNPYSKADVLDYWAFCDRQIDQWIDALDLSRADCGFHWYRVSKLEHQIVNIRHIQHHTAQLADRLRAAHGIGVRWAGSGRRA
jgi:hypothetical protein